MRLYTIYDKDLPNNLKTVRDIFEPKESGERKVTESLHDYLTRKKIKCFCPECRATLKQTEAH